MLPLRYGVGSDYHWGNMRLDAGRMLAGHRKFFHPVLKTLNLLFINGDWFDAGIELVGKSSPDIMSGTIELLEECNRLGLTIRIVQGTWTHDRNQLFLFETLHAGGKYTNNLKLIRAVSLEYIEEFDMRVLYIPDDMPYGSSDELMEDVAKQMADLGWDYVDLAFVHGTFEHVVPPNVAKDIKIVFRREQFGFVRYNIHCGHIHTPSTRWNIYYNGSFDRNAHGEEEAKGFLTVDFDGKKSNVTFIENEYATIFKTFDYTRHEDLDILTEQFLKDVRALPDDQKIFVRVVHPKREVRAGLGKLCSSKFKHIVYTHKEVAGVEDETDYVTPEEIPEQTVLLPPTPENLPNLILEHITPTDGTSPISLERVNELLEKLSA